MITIFFTFVQTSFLTANSLTYLTSPPIPITSCPTTPPGTTRPPSQSSEMPVTTPASPAPTLAHPTTPESPQVTRADQARVTIPVQTGRHTIRGTTVSQIMVGPPSLRLSITQLIIALHRQLPHQVVLVGQGSYRQPRPRAP